MKLAALIIETRSYPTLVNVINNHIKYLPENTQLIIYNGIQTEYLKKLFPKAIFDTVGVNTMQEYNQLLTCANFWQNLLEYDRILIFQSDSFMVRTGIEEFYEWDYVGIPWLFHPYVGNGGFSLRNPKVMYEICQSLNWDITQGNEDVAICNYIIKNKIGKLAPLEVAKKFGVENIMELGALGGHAIEKWLNQEQCKQIYEQYNK